MRQFLLRGGFPEIQAVEEPFRSRILNDLYLYLAYLHDAYLIFPVAIHSRSERIRRTNPHKIYTIDTGMNNAFASQGQVDWGRLLENFVYLTLRRQGLNIEYYRTKANTEVDFITSSTTGEQSLYQVALNINDLQTHIRAIQALEIAMHECNVKVGRIITLDHKEIIQTSNGKIEILPVWEWADLREGS